MLTESCVMFFSPSLAILSSILQDEYLTSAVRTKEGEGEESPIYWVTLTCSLSNSCAMVTGSRGDLFVVRTSKPTSEKMGYFDRVTVSLHIL